MKKTILLIVCLLLTGRPGWAGLYPSSPWFGTQVQNQPDAAGVRAALDLTAGGGSGTNGLNGLNGTNGLNGINGTNGLNGADGATGPIGPPGPAGPAGADGTGGGAGATVYYVDTTAGDASFPLTNSPASYVVFKTNLWNALLLTGNGVTNSIVGTARVQVDVAGTNFLITY